MPTRNNSIIRRDINRLNDLINRRSGEEGALSVIADVVSSAADKVNAAWQAYQAVAVAGDKEREERDTAIEEVVSWIQRWRPVVMIKIPGAETNLKNLPNKGATPDDAVRVVEDMLEFMNKNPNAQSFVETAMQNLGNKLENAKKEIAEATAVLPQEAVCRDTYTEACLEANTILVRGLDIIRSAFGRTSPEYKQFIARSGSKEEEEEEPALAGAAKSQ